MRRTVGLRTGLPALALGLSLASLAVLGTPGGAHAATAAKPGHGKHAAAKTTATKPTVVLTPGTTYAASTSAQAQEIQIPVADGLTPHQVHGTLVFDNDAAGTVQVLAHGQVVASVHKDAATTSAPVTIPVGAQDVSGGHLTLSLRYLADEVDNRDLSCLESNDGTVELTDVTVDATGTAQAPTTLATFFGQGVTAVSIVVPVAGTASMQAAGLAAEAALVHRYPAAAVTVTTAEDATRAAAVTPEQGRVVRFVSGTGEVKTAIEDTSGVPTLTLTGDPAKLAAAAAALGSDDLALGETATATRLEQSGVVGGASSETFADLGQSAPSLQGLGRSSFTLTVRQSDFGASVKQMKVHLVGRYTELPASVQAVLTYTWNGQVLGSQVLRNTDTTIDRTLTVPATQLSFSNTLKVQLSAVPSGNSETGTSSAGCGPLAYLPIQATFDGKASAVSAVRGQSADPGFARFPQTLGNVLTTAFSGTATADDLTNAAAVLRALQQLNTDQLQVNVVSAEQLTSSSASGLLVGATSAQVDDLQAPLRMDEFRSIDQEDVHFGVGVTDPFAALQGFHQNGRDLLVLSSWSPDAAGQDTGRRLQSALVDDLAGTNGAWYGLVGDVLVRQQADGENVSLDSNSVVPQPAKVHHLATYAWWIIAFVGLLCLLLLAQWLSTRRLRQRARRLVDAQEVADAEADAAAGQDAGAADDGEQGESDDGSSR